MAKLGPRNMGRVRTAGKDARSVRNAQDLQTVMAQLPQDLPSRILLKAVEVPLRVEPNDRLVLDSAEAVDDLDTTAALEDVIETVNTLLANLRAVGFLKE